MPYEAPSPARALDPFGPKKWRADASKQPLLFLLETLEAHFLDCLSYIIWWKKDPYTGEKLVYADLGAIEGLFLSYEGFKSKIEKFKCNKLYDIELLNELRRLVDVSKYSRR